MRAFSVLRSVVCAAAILLTGAVFAEEKIVSFNKELFFIMGVTTDAEKGAKTFIFRSDRTVALENRYILRKTLDTVGGIIFMAVAEPNSELANQCPAITLSFNVANGGRLTYKFPKSGPAHSTIYDWELAPTIDFVITGDDGLFTYMGYEAAYHPSFNNTLAGVELFLLDTSRWNNSFPRSHLLLENDNIPGFPQIEPSEGTEQSWREVANLLGSSQLIFSDRNVNYQFGLSGSELYINGKPHWNGVTNTESGELGEIIKVFNEEEEERLFKTNPVIYNSVTRIARHVALFNYFSRECEKEWSNFLAIYATERKKLDTVKVPNIDMPVKID